MFDVASLIIVVVIVGGIGALAAIVRPDHRNPVTRPFVDWIEHHARLR